jgi:DMSO/TMAO reductase YedYZ molybdopterin-dependent catalytic subunit
MIDANPRRHRLRIAGVKDRSHPRQAGRGILAGLLTAWVALGAAQLVAGIGRPQGSPIAAVGSLAIDHTPPGLKNFAISAFGTHDKTALVTGILVVLAALAAVIGLAAMRRAGYGLAGLAVFAVIGLTAALTRPDASIWDALPTLIGVAVGGYVLTLLVRMAQPPAPAPPPAAARTAPAADPPADPPPERAPAGWARGGPGAADWVPAGPAAGSPTGADTSTPAGRDAGLRSGPPVPPPADTGRRPPGRRAFLAAGTAAFAAGGVAVLAGRSLAERSNVTTALADVRLPRAAHPAAPLPPGTSFDVPGLSPFITPNGSFYRVDTALLLPEVAPHSWQLRIHGLVEREITLDYAELLRRPLTEDYITLTCVSNPVAGPYVGNAKWLGASLASLLRTARVKAGADQLLCTSTDGFTSGTPIATVLDGRDALLAVGMNGAPLPVAHGFPVRMVVPGLYGYVSATKWVTDIKVTTFAGEAAYWAQRGWSPQAPIKTECRIDVPGGSVRAGRRPVAGVAWAQHKGIDAVHVRVDGGAWQQARLAAVPGIDCWRQWVWDWDATHGSHVIEARATDATGYTQTAAQAPPEPNGASGYPRVTVSVT